MAKLNKTQKIEIITQYRCGISQRNIAKKYDVSQSLIRNVVKEMKDYKAPSQSLEPELRVNGTKEVSMGSSNSCEPETLIIPYDVSLVSLSEQGALYTTSLAIAKYFDKRHDNVLRDIREARKKLDEVGADHWTYKYITRTYNAADGNIHDYYRLGEGLFNFVVMGYTGDKAAKYKYLFINEFFKQRTIINNSYTAQIEYLKQSSTHAYNELTTENANLRYQLEELNKTMNSDFLLDPNSTINDYAVKCKYQEDALSQANQNVVYQMRQNKLGIEGSPRYTWNEVKSFFQLKDNGNKFTRLANKVLEDNGYIRNKSKNKKFSPVEGLIAYDRFGYSDTYDNRFSDSFVSMLRGLLKAKGYLI